MITVSPIGQENWVDEVVHIGGGHSENEHHWGLKSHCPGGSQVLVCMHIYKHAYL